MVSNASGVAVWKSSSLPFGQATVDEDPDGDSVLFSLNKRLPGQYYDSETSQHYNYFRDYLPNIGRYIQTDPIGLAGGINRYAYVHNSPIQLYDPFGLKVWWVGRPLNNWLFGHFWDHEGIKINDDYYGYDGKKGAGKEKWDPTKDGYHEHELGDDSWDEYYRQAIDNLMKSGDWDANDYNYWPHNCWAFREAVIEEAKRLRREAEEKLSDGGWAC